MLILYAATTAHAQTTLDTAVNFSVKDTYGNTIELFPILDQNKFVVIDFFSTACGACQLYAPDMQAAYEAFGCNEGNVFVMGIDKGNDNIDVILFDSIYGIQYPGISGNEGGGNLVHMNYELQGTPTVVVIDPDRSIAVKQVYPPNTANLVDTILWAGGLLASCMTGIAESSAGENLKIWPNPAGDVIHTAFQRIHSGPVGFEVIDMAGNRVLMVESEWLGPGSHAVQINSSALRSGIYLLRMTDAESSTGQSARVVIR